MEESGAAAICTALRFLTRAGLVDYNGHASLRQGDGFLVNSAASNRAAPVPEEISTVALDGTPLAGPVPPNEAHLHAAIYRARPDAAAVVHGHPTWICTLTSTGAGLAPVVPQAALVHDLPRYEAAHSISDGARGDAVARVLGTGRGVLLMGHGIVTVGPDLLTACTLALYAEQTAERQVRAAPLGGARLLAEAEVAEYRRTLDRPGLFAKCRDFYLTGQGG